MPTIWIDIGRPFAACPMGIDMAGLPVRLNAMLWIGDEAGLRGPVASKRGAVESADAVIITS